MVENERIEGMCQASSSLNMKNSRRKYGITGEMLTSLGTKGKSKLPGDLNFIFKRATADQVWKAAILIPVRPGAC